MKRRDLFTKGPVVAAGTILSAAGVSMAPATATVPKVAPKMWRLLGQTKFRMIIPGRNWGPLLYQVRLARFRDVDYKWVWRVLRGG